MKIRTESYAGVGAGVLVLACSMACGPTAPVRQVTTDTNRLVRSWEQAFANGQEIDLEVPVAGPKILQIGRLAVRSDRRLIIPDARAKRILIFEPDGTLVQRIEGGDQGVFELSILAAAALADDGNILVFDPDGNRVTVLQAPEYKTFRRFQIPVKVAQMLPLTDGSFLAYAPTEEKVFQRFDQSGKRLAAAYRVRDERLRLFHSRVQTGGIALSSRGDVFGIHPAAYELVRMSPKLHVTEILRAPNDDARQPQPKELPEGLSPYDYTPDHEDWWDTFDHIGTIHALDEDLLLVTVFSSSGLREWRESVNIYQLNGAVRLLAAGLQVPHGARVVGTRGNEIYIARNARLGDGESMEPLALYRYQVDLKSP